MQLELSADTSKMLHDKTLLLYLFVVMSYYDDNVPDGYIRKTEFCGSVNGNFEGWLPCHSHNRTYLEKLQVF